MITHLFLLISLLHCSSSLKILGYNPIFSHSHANFMGKIADVLSEAGHEVVLLSPIVHTGLRNRTSEHARVIYVPPSELTKEFGKKGDNSMSKMWTADNHDVFTLDEHVTILGRFLGHECETTLTTPGLIEQLREEKFDVAYSEDYCSCAFAIFRLLGIKKYAVTQSIVFMDGSDRLTGVPSFPSYVPALLSPFGAEMSMYERFMNMRYTFYFDNIMQLIRGPAQAVVRRIHPGIPPVEELISNSTFFFVNSEPLIDFSRPTIHKVVEVGGISVPVKHKPLDQHFSSLLSLRSRTVLISFGTMIHAQFMPEKFKESIRQAAQAFPDVTFIWKYEKPENDVAKDVDNLVTSEWVPQFDLLRSGGLSAFVTHGGQGSTTEATLCGVPLIAIPVQGDQKRNGQAIQRLGNGIHLHKDSLYSSHALIDALRQVLHDDSYSSRARHIAAMVAAQPQSVRDRLVSHFEFMANFGPLPQLDHIGRKMSFITLHNLDIILIASAVILVASVTALFVLFQIVRFLSSLRIKSKKE